MSILLRVLLDCLYLACPLPSSSNNVLELPSLSYAKMLVLESFVQKAQSLKNVPFN